MVLFLSGANFAWRCVDELCDVSDYGKVQILTGVIGIHFTNVCSTLAQRDQKG